MQDASFIALVHNAALMLAFALIFDVLHLRRNPKIPSWLYDALIGLLLGCIGIAVMNSPWVLTPGIIFDTRSVLIGLSGIFFGPISTIILIVMTASLRFHIGGAAMVMGVSVIIESGVIGMLWGHYRRQHLNSLSWSELYAFGLIIHLIMLFLTFTMPLQMALHVFSNIAIPVMVIYPIATVLIGKLFVNRLIRDESVAMLQKSREQYRMITENMKDVIWILDLHSGRYTYVSPSVQAMNGYTAEEIMAAPVDLSFTDDSRNSFLQILSKRRDDFLANTIAPHTSFTDENELPCKAGGCVSTEVVSTIYLNTETQHVELRGITRDISERRKAEKEILKAKEEAEIASRKKSFFLSSMSHELRTPLNIVLGYVEELQELCHLCHKNKAPQLLPIIMKSGKRLLDTINSILDISKVESNQMRINVTPFCLKTAIQDVADLFSGRAHKKDLSLNVQMNELPTEKVSGDVVRLQQILVNLIHNAIKFTEKGSVTVQVDYRDGEAHFIIRDTGIGIPEKDWPRVFEPFFQTDQLNTTTISGSGLGLSITKGLVELMNGTITFQSEASKGTLFFVSIPLPLSSEHTLIPNTKHYPRRTNAPMPRILFVDDSKENIDLLSFYLRSFSIRIDTAESAMTCMSQIQKHHYDLIFMDIQMPEIDGYTATRMIREMEQKTPAPISPNYIVACTAYAFEEDVLRSREAGCQEHLAKPIRKEQLFAMLEMFSIPMIKKS